MNNYEVILVYGKTVLVKGAADEGEAVDRAKFESGMWQLGDLEIAVEPVNEARLLFVQQAADLVSEK